LEITALKGDPGNNSASGGGETSDQDLSPRRGE
jgi:hypothetical protein